MESAWQQCLDRLASPDPSLSYDEVCAWAQDEYDCLVRAGIIREVAAATRIVCEACPDAHWEPVFWGRDGTAFIICPNAGLVAVESERMRQWQVDPQHLATLLAKSLSTSGPPRYLAAGRFWCLGQIGIGKRKPYVFLAFVDPDAVDGVERDIRRGYGQAMGMLFVPFTPEQPETRGRIQLVDIRTVCSLQNGKVVVDDGVIQALFAEAASSPKTLPPGEKGNILQRHRLGILKAAVAREELPDMDALGRHVGASADALYAMARDDQRKFGEEKLKAVLKAVGCSRQQWDRPPKPAKSR